MKKTMRMIVAALLSLLLISAIAAPVAAEAYTAMDMYEDSYNDMMDSYQDAVDQMQQQREEADRRHDEFRREMERSRRIGTTIGIIWGIVVLSFAGFVFGSMIHLSVKSMGKKELPPRRRTPYTITAGPAPYTCCPKCGQPFGESTFCPTCGVSKQSKAVYQVPIDKRMTAQKFEETINEWFATNPYIYNCRIHLDTRASILSPFVQYKFFVKSARIEYSVAPQPQKQVGLAFAYKFRVLGPIGYSYEKQVAQWQQNNPDCKIISHMSGGRIQHLDNKGGIWAQYYNYILFTK